MRLTKTKKQFQRHNFSMSKKWFDGDCRIQRRKLRNISNEKHKNPDDENRVPAGFNSGNLRPF